VDGTTVPIAHDASGRLVDDGRFTYTYDIKNRLVAVRQAGVVVEAYAYDAASRLVAVFDGTGLKERFVYDGAQMVAAFDATGAPLWDALWGPGLDHLLQWRDLAGDGEARVPVTDHRRSVVGVWNGSDDLMEELVEYDAHGRRTVMDPDQTPTCQEQGSGDVCSLPGGMPFGFVSAWTSSVTGLVQMRARWYSPRLAQFVSQDPLGYVDSFNPYAYVGMDPVNGWDPWGLENSLAEQAYARILNEGRVYGLPVAVIEQVMMNIQISDSDGVNQFRWALRYFLPELLIDKALAQEILNAESLSDVSTEVGTMYEEAIHAWLWMIVSEPLPPSLTHLRNSVGDYYRHAAVSDKSNVLPEDSPDPLLYRLVGSDDDGERAFQEAIGEYGSALVVERLSYISTAQRFSSREAISKRGIDGARMIYTLSYKDYIDGVEYLREDQTFGYIKLSNREYRVVNRLHPAIVNFVHKIVFDDAEFMERWSAKVFDSKGL